MAFWKKRNKTKTHIHTHTHTHRPHGTLARVTFKRGEEEISLQLERRMTDMQVSFLFLFS